jgi:hypothetical protein
MVPQLIEQGYLVGTRTYAPTPPDLKGIKVQAGDYSGAAFPLSRQLPIAVAGSAGQFADYSSGCSARGYVLAAT